MHKQTGLFVNINYLFSFYWHYTGCAAMREMHHLHCFLAMRTPTTTPISSATPTSNHLLRVSRDLLASAAASRPKTSAKQSWNSDKNKKQGEEFCYMVSLHPCYRNTPPKNLQLWQKLLELKNFFSNLHLSFTYLLGDRGSAPGRKCQKISALK